MKLKALALVYALTATPSAAGMTATTTVAPLYTYSVVTGVDYRSDAGAMGRLVIDGGCLVLKTRDGHALPVVFDLGTRFTRKSVRIGSKSVAFSRAVDNLGLRITIFPERLIHNLESSCVKAEQDVALLD